MKRYNGLGGLHTQGRCLWCDRPLRPNNDGETCKDKEDCYAARERKGERLEREYDRLH